MPATRFFPRYLAVVGAILVSTSTFMIPQLAQAKPEVWQAATPKPFTSAGEAYSVFNEASAPLIRNMPLQFEYALTGYELVNHGSYFQLNFEPGNRLSFDGQSYQLQALRLHRPGENIWQGKRALVEGHLLFANEQGQQTIIMMNFVLGKENPWFVHAWHLLPGAGKTFSMRRKVSLQGLFPEDSHYYRFNGQAQANSATTGQQSQEQQGLRWLILEKPLTLSESQHWLMRQALTQKVTPTSETLNQQRLK